MAVEDGGERQKDQKVRLGTAVDSREKRGE